MASEPLTPSDRDALRAVLRRIGPLAETDLSAVEAYMRVRRLARGEVFLRPGDRAVECGTILTGMIREYYLLADGREVTRWFAGPGDNLGSLSDLLGAAPARSIVVAEVAARVVVLPWLRLRAIADQRPAWALVLARITERLYVAKAAREYELLALDACARYLRFRAQFAALEPVIALRHVASYVGITPEHLSRLRGRLGGAPAPAARVRARAAPRPARRARPARRR